MYSEEGHAARYQWIVPRRVMCALFWAGVLLIFIGMILLVTSQHKGKVFQSWGAVVLGLGLCVLLACIILCVHTYFVMSSRRNNQELENSESDSKKFAHMTNAIIATAMSPGPPSDALNGTSMAPLVAPPRLAQPPHYGVSVTTTPAPTVRLYVSDIAAERNIRSVPPEIVIVEAQSSSDQNVALDSNHVINDRCENESVRGGDENGGSWHQQVSTRADRKSSYVFEAPGFVASQIPESVESQAADAWLSQQQTTPRTVPLPFPPANITFDALDEIVNDDVLAHDGTSAGVGISSCDESFSQSTETIVARDNNDKSSSKKSTAPSRRKSLYYNTADQALGANGSGTAGGQQQQPVAPVTSSVTLPRHVAIGNSRKPPRVDHVDFASKTATNVPKSSRSERRLIDADNSSKTTVRIHGGEEDDRTISSAAIHETSGTLSKAANRPSANCRVTRINLHSITNSEVNATAAQVSPPLSPTSPDASTLPTYSDVIANEVRPLPTSVRGLRFQTVGGRSDATITGDAPDAGASASASLSRDRRVGGAIPTTARTCGPACVTVTPLRPSVVAVEQCPRFPASKPSKTGGERRGGGGPGGDDDPMEALDAVDLLRAEYEASFGGQVNPLLLYSGGLADEDVNLSKSTVYDNIQYFRV